MKFTLNVCSTIAAEAIEEQPRSTKTQRSKNLGNAMLNRRLRNNEEKIGKASSIYKNNFRGLLGQR